MRSIDVMVITIDLLAVESAHQFRLNVLPRMVDEETHNGLRYKVHEILPHLQPTSHHHARQQRVAQCPAFRLAVRHMRRILVTRVTPQAEHYDANSMGLSQEIITRDYHHKGL